MKQASRRGWERRGRGWTNAAALRTLVLTMTCCTLASGSIQAWGQNRAEIFVDPGAPASISPDADALGTFPTVEGQVLMVLEDRRIYSIQSDRGGPPIRGWNTLEPIVQGLMVAKLSSRFSLSSMVQVRSFGTDNVNRRFDSLDGQVINFFSSYELERGRSMLFAGKYDAGFGEAWRTVDGVYSGFSDDYFYQGSVGVGARKTWSAEASPTHTVTALLFKRDTSVWSDTLVKRRPLVRLQSSDGGPGNTDWPQSYGVSYGLSDIPGAPGLALGLDVARLAKSHHDERALTGVAATVNYATQIGPRTGLHLFGEWMHADGFLGKPLVADYGTISASLSLGNMVWTATAARRNIRAQQDDLAKWGVTNAVDNGYALSGTYNTPIGLLVQAGVIRQKEQGISATQGVIRLIYQLSF